MPAGRVPVSKVRTAGFAASVLLLVAAVPTLGWVGVKLIRDSKAGKLVTRVSDPRAPGYEAIVDPTPTALLIQRNATGALVGLTFLALGGSAGGGSAMFIPVDTAVTNPARLADRFSTVSRTGGEQALVAAVGTTLNVGSSDVVDMDDARWADLAANTAPVELDNPDSVTAGGSRYPAGRIALGAKDVGPYLAALNSGESELNRLNRQQVFWQAWLKKIAASTASDVIPGETKTGIGYFVRTLSKGPVRFDALPVTAQPTPGRGATGELFHPVAEQLREDVAAIVPYPTAPSPQARISVRLLNGVDGGPIPQSLVHQLVRNGATISVVGNDERFGRAKTSIQYRDSVGRNGALFLKHALGGKARVVLNLQGSDAVDVTIILGRDVLPAGRSTARDATSPTSAARPITTTTRSQATGG